MKTSQIILLLVGLALVGTSNAQTIDGDEDQPQNPISGPIVGYFTLGNGIAGGAGLGLLADSLYVENKIKSPVVSVGADFLPGRRFSIGLLAAYQQINVTLDDTLNTFREEGNIHRFYAGFRGLWHYGKGERVDLYSGFKLGVVRFSSGAITGPDANNSVLEANNNRTRYSLGIIPIGARINVTNELGLQVQMSIGAPTFVSAGVCYKIR